MKQISCTEDTWVDEESLAVTPTLKPIRVNDPWQGMSEEEVEDHATDFKCVSFPGNSIVSTTFGN